MEKRNYIKKKRVGFYRITPEVVKRAKKGDESAKKLIYDTYRLRFTASGYTGLTDDEYNTMMMNFFSRIHNFYDDGPVYSYLLVSYKNILYNRYKKYYQKKYMPTTCFTDLGEKELGIYFDPSDINQEDVNEKKELINSIIQYVRANFADKNYCDIWYMYVVDGYSLREVGNKYNYSREKVRQIVSLIQQQIKKNFSRDTDF